jgi:hypothetical protein
MNGFLYLSPKFLKGCILLLSKVRFKPFARWHFQCLGVCVGEMVYAAITCGTVDFSSGTV